MSRRECLHVGLAVLFALVSAGSFAQGQGHGHGRGKHRGRDDEAEDRYYSDADRTEIRSWYDEHQDDLPPGLAKRDRLPPGLERQLIVRGTLPPGLRKKIRLCPEDLQRHLPPPPPDCEHVIIGGHVVLMNRKTLVVLDILHLER